MKIIWFHGLAFVLTGCLALFTGIFLKDKATAAAQTETHGFSALYTAGRLVLEGRDLSALHDWDWFRARTVEYGYAMTDVFWGNLPPLAVFLAPFAIFSPETSKAVWIFFSVLASLAGLEILRQALFPSSLSLSSTAGIFALFTLMTVFDPLHSSLHYGQIYPFLLFLQSVGCAFWLRNQHTMAGLCLGSVLAFKGYGALLLLLALFRRDFRVVLGALVAFAGWAAASLYWMGVQPWLDLAQVHLTDPRFAGPGIPVLQTLRSFILAVSQSGQGDSIGLSQAWSIFTLFAVAQLGLLLWFSSTTKPLHLALAACSAASLIFSPRAENYAFCMLLTPIWLLLPILGRLNWQSCIWMAACFLLAWPFQFQTLEIASWQDAFLGYPRLSGALLLLGAAVFSCRHAAHFQNPLRGAPILAWCLGLASILLYVKPWKPELANPLMAVSHTDGDRVSVYRLDFGERRLFTTPVTCDGPFGLAIHPARRWLYAGCTDNSEVSVIDLETRREERVLASEKLPAWANMRPNTDEIWITNEGASSLTIRNALTSAYISQIGTDPGPADLVFIQQGKVALVANEGAANLAWIDTAARKVKDRISVGKVPQGLAVTPDEQWLVSANYSSNSVSLVDLKKRVSVAEISVAEGPVDVVIPAWESGRYAYVSCHTNGMLSVVDLKDRKEVARKAVGKKLFGIAAHPSANRIYVCSGGTNQVVVVRGGPNPAVLHRIAAGGTPLQITVLP